jgi:hypothetical protein
VNDVTEIGLKKIFLDDGKVLEAIAPIHARQDYTLTSKSAQAHDADITVAFLPAEAASAMSAEQMLVTISRPKNELIITTNSIDVVREHKVHSHERQSATDLLKDKAQKAVSARQKQLIAFCIGLARKAAMKKAIKVEVKQDPYIKD